MIFTPRPYQELIYRHILEHKRCAIWAGMGMGKTSGTLNALTALQLVDPRPTLCLAPLRVARTVWPPEVDKWENFHGYKVVSIEGTPAQRKAAVNTPADMHTINYENIPWLVQSLGINAWKWSNVIADESTKLKSFRLRSGGRRAADLAKVAFSKVDRFVELTGTPSPNGLIDLWGQLYFLDKGERLGRTFSAFMGRWFRKPYPQSFDMVPTAGAETEIMQIVSDICLSVRPEDYFDLAAPIVVDVPAHLPDQAMKLYKKMENELFFEIKGQEVEAFNAAAKTMKCLQIANGAVYTESGYEIVHDAKLEALDDIIEEAGGAPILVAYHFKTDLDRLKKRYKQGEELTQDPAVLKRWNAGKIPLLFAHPASAGHGLNLQDGGNIVVIFGHWWDLEQYQQIIERIGPVRQLQAGYNRPVYIYNIRAVGTIDSTVIQSRTDKRRVQDLLLETASRG